MFSAFDTVTLILVPENCTKFFFQLSFVDKKEKSNIHAIHIIECL